MEFLKETWNTEPRDFVGYGINKDGRWIPMTGLHLISHITDNLYVGGHSEFVDLGDAFSHIFSLYVWGDPYNSHVDTVHRKRRMFDSVDQDPEVVQALVDEVVEALNKGGNVLVHCQAGINRSNLVAALVLRKWKGLTSAQAIDMLREKRSHLVLANPTFEAYLRGLDKE